MPALVAVLDNLAHVYTDLKRRDPNSPALRRFEIEIENIDSQLLIASRCAQVLVGVMHFYWRMGYTSVETAAMVRIKPPAVRIMLHRLRRVAKSLGFE